MKNLRVITKVLGIVETDVYIVWNKDTKGCFIVDPADRADEIEAAISAEGLKPEAVLLTHGHFDHILAADDLRKKYGIQIYAMEDEKTLLEDPELNSSLTFRRDAMSLHADNYLHDGDKLELAGVEIIVMATPGHTAGSCCYYIPKESVLFSGDTMFEADYGRCDLPTGSESAIIRSITTKILTLPDDTIVYPGHMDATSIEYEKKHNPAAVYMKG